MSRFRSMLPLVLVLTVNLPLGLFPAEAEAQPSGHDPAYPHQHRAWLIVDNIPLAAEIPGELYSGIEILSVFAAPEWLAEATPDPGKYAISFNPFRSTRVGGVFGQLVVACREERPPAEVKKIVALAEKKFEQALREIHEANMAPLYDRLKRAEFRLAEARDVAEKRRIDVQSLRTRLVQFDASPEGIDQQQNTLRQDRLKLRVELVGLKARREAIVRAVAEASDKLNAISDEQQRELAELAKIVDLRGQQLARVKGLYKGNSASISEIQQAELEVARAKADLAERRRLIAQQAGSEQLSRLNQQLADVQIEMSAAEARVAGIEAMLNRLQSKEVLELLAQYGQATQQLEYARAEEKAAFEQVAEAKKTAESTPAPKVVEIRGPAAPK